MDLTDKINNFCITEQRDGSLQVYINGKLYDFAGDHIGGEVIIDLFDDNLNCKILHDYDIVRIYSIIKFGDFIRMLTKFDIHDLSMKDIEEQCRCKLIWDRQKPLRKTMTVSQIEKELGYPIEIVSEEDV